MTTQMPLLGSSTANGYKPATAPGAVRDTADGVNTRPQSGSASTTPSAAATAAAAPRPVTPTGSTPGAGASVAAPDTSALGQDPGYLAYLRSLGVADTTHSAAIQSQIDALNRNVALRLPQMQQADQYANQGLLNGMEARGLLNSGETENKLAHQQQGQQAQAAALQDQAAQRSADLLNQLAEFRANQGVGAAEQGLRAGQTLATQGGNQQNANQAAAIGTALGI